MTHIAGQQAYAPFLQPEVPFRDLRPYVFGGCQTPLTFCREDVSLVIRQQPAEALIAIDGKEKGNTFPSPRTKLTRPARKPLDPAPIVELRVAQKADPPK